MWELTKSFRFEAAHALGGTTLCLFQGSQSNHETGFVSS